MSSSRRVFVIGVGMTKFEKPGRRINFDYPDMAKEAVTKALLDAKTNYDEIQQAFVGYVYGDSTCGQRALYQFGHTTIPIINVNNNCSTGSSALFMAYQMIKGGLIDCGLVLGFEKMQTGSLKSMYTDRSNPIEEIVVNMARDCGIDKSPVSCQLFGNAGREHMKKYGTKPEHFAKIAFKNHKHAVNNPYSQFQDEYTLQEILESPMIFDPLTKLQCCPTSDGAASAILSNEDFIRKNNLYNQAVEILGMEMATDPPSSFEDSSIKRVGFDMTKKAAMELYKKTGLWPQNVDVVELHDCFSTNELITYEALGLCEEGKAADFIDQGNNTYGGKYVVNPSGGLLSKGHPLGATGIAQCSELCWQLRDLAGKRQVPNAKVALQHNIGLGGAVVIALYRLGFPHSINSNKKQIIPSNVSALKDFKSAPIFKTIEETLNKNGSEIVKKINGIYCFKLREGPDNQEGHWVVDCKNGSGSVEFKGDAKPDCTISMRDEDFVKLMNGKLNPQAAFFTGKLKIAGNLGLARKLSELQQRAENSKL